MRVSADGERRQDRVGAVGAAGKEGGGGVYSDEARLLLLKEELDRLIAKLSRHLRKHRAPVSATARFSHRG